MVKSVTTSPCEVLKSIEADICSGVVVIPVEERKQLVAGFEEASKIKAHLHAATVLEQRGGQGEKLFTDLVKMGLEDVEAPTADPDDDTARSPKRRRHVTSPLKNDFTEADRDAKKVLEQKAHANPKWVQMCQRLAVRRQSDR